MQKIKVMPCEMVVENLDLWKKGLQNLGEESKRCVLFLLSGDQ